MEEEGTLIGHPHFGVWRRVDDEYEATLVETDDRTEVRTRRIGDSGAGEVASYGGHAPVFTEWVPAGELIEVTIRPSDLMGSVRVRRQGIRRPGPVGLLSVL